MELTWRIGEYLKERRVDFKVGSSRRLVANHDFLRGPASHDAEAIAVYYQPGCFYHLYNTTDVYQMHPDPFSVDQDAHGSLKAFSSFFSRSTLIFWFTELPKTQSGDK